MFDDLNVRCARRIPAQSLRRIRMPNQAGDSGAFRKCLSSGKHRLPLVIPRYIASVAAGRQK
ncbi:hypothetical protein [Paraburkholderia solisilvae]|uniref:hypothetical protein n=1 Tax=Paraburkholderia solisilvae TaxID=624376 RepID=UPI001582BD55|nr:hypothetical protein [Paraburkholderia solisilvae]